jgi:hypothetical protein
MIWTRVGFELARSQEVPEGSHQHGYEFVPPLDATGHIDRAAYRRVWELCTVHRFGEGSEDLIGVVHHATHDRWIFSFHPGEMEDEPIPLFVSHAFREGEYVTVRETTSGEHTFHVIPV